MATAAREDDMLVVTIEVRYPDWLDELDEDEFESVMKSAEGKAICALAGKIHEAEGFWRARKMLTMAGQTDIYDYV